MPKRQPRRADQLDVDHHGYVAEVPATDAARAALLDAASALLVEEGPQALSVRRIAERAGTSTMGLYSHLGGKDGVVEALFVEGFTRLADGMARVRTTTDPMADLRRVGRHYRRFALDHPGHYLVMFGRPVPEWTPSESAMAEAGRSLDLLRDRIQRCLDVGVFDPGHGDAEHLAHSVWAVVHGLCSLELAAMGRTGHEARIFEHTLDVLDAGLVAPPR